MSDATAALGARLARLVEEVSGNVVVPGQYPFLIDLARGRAVELAIPTLEAYLGELEGGTLPEEWRDLLPRITVKESYLFRAPQQFVALRNWLVPRLLEARCEERTLRIWSAGCARGEEPATLAIVLAEDPRLAGWEWRIVATDVDEQALAQGRSGLFRERAVQGVAPELLERYFRRRGDRYELAESLCKRIEFRALNLIREPFPYPAEPYDLILLRNVLIYFRIESQRRVVAQTTGSLARDGLLFLGPAETLWQLSSALAPIDFGDCFGYGYASSPGHDATNLPPAALRASGSVRAAEPRPEPARIGEAVAPPLPVAAGTRERVREASERLAAGDLASSQRLGEEALRSDPVDPGAHALEGRAHALAGRAQSAVASFRASLFLEPNLFQARFWLAEILLQMGQNERARHELREALSTLDAGRGRELAELRALAPPTPETVRQRSFQLLRELG